jgi:hypothetical protein
MIEVKLKPNIKTKEIAFDLQNDAKTVMFVESFNYVPFLALSKTNDPNIDGTTIDPKDVVYVKLHNSKFLPEIELSCYDSKGIFISDLYPLDHDVLLSIFVKSNSELTMPIRMDFRVTEYETSKTQDNNYTLKYTIKGILDLDELHFTRYEARKGTSYNVIQDIAKQLNLGFATNVEASDDEMTWLNCSDTYIHFISEITGHAFINEKSFIWTFIDFYYNLNYINIELELNNFNKQEQQMLANTQAIKKDDESTVNLYLTNKPSFNMTNKYIQKFNIINQSFKVNLEKSYRMKSTWYDKNENKSYRHLLADIETEGQNVQPLYDYNSSIFNENINDEYFIAKSDTDNVHKNFALAKVTNNFNLENLQKIKMIVTLNQINFDIKRFQNIKVEIYNINDILSQNAGQVSGVDNINTKLSGFWFVTGINYLYRRIGGVEQEITLMRRDLSINYGGGSDEKSDLRILSKDVNQTKDQGVVYPNSPTQYPNTQDNSAQIKKINEQIANVTTTWNKEGSQRKIFDAEIKRLNTERDKLLNK